MAAAGKCDAARAALPWAGSARTPYVCRMTLTDRAASPRISPPAPVPRAGQLRPLAFLRTLRRNPLETWTRAHFERPILSGRGLLGIGAVVSHPPSIRRVLLDNAANYRKDALQKRILAPGLSDGLLTVEGEAWKVQRRAIAPMFTPRLVHAFAAAMAAKAEDMVDRWARLRPGRVIDAHKAHGARHARHPRRDDFLRRARPRPRRVHGGDGPFLRQCRHARPGRSSRLSRMGAAPRTDQKPPVDPILREGGGCHRRASQGATRRRDRAAFGSADAAAAGQRPADRDRTHGRGGARQHHHVHRRRARDDGERADLVAVSALPFAGLARPPRRGGGPRARRADRDGGRAPGRDPRV